MTWVTSKRHPKRGVHRIADNDFDPQRHTRAEAPPNADALPEVEQGDGSPDISTQEAAEEAAKALKAEESEAPAEPKPKKGKKATEGDE